MAFFFRAYELNFESAFEHTGIFNNFSCNSLPDVTIEIGAAPACLDFPTIQNDYFQITPHNFLLTIPNVARYHVYKGQQVIVDPFPNADQDKIRLFLFGSAMGAVLYQRGLFPLHGSAISTEHGVVIFVGPQGIGKSTLAAHFQRRGYYLLSDDVCAITKHADSTFQVLPAFSQLRLCTDAFERLGNTSVNMTSARFDVDKYVVSLTQASNSECYPLYAIYQLTDHDLPVIIQKKMQGFERFNLLLSNLYRISYLPGFETKGEIMQTAASIAKVTEIYEILRPRNHERIEELADILEEKWDTN